MKKSARAPRPPVAREAKPAEERDREGVAAAKEAALPSGAEHVLRDVEAQRQAHLLAGSMGDASAFHAFEALALHATAKADKVDRERNAAGLEPIGDFAIEAPEVMVQVPAWAAMAILYGWNQAVRGVVNEGGKRGAPLPMIEAFGLGGANDRTVPARHSMRARYLSLAIKVALVLRAAEQEGRAISETSAIASAATAQISTKPTCRRAWKAHQALARAIVDAGVAKTPRV